MSVQRLSQLQWFGLVAGVIALAFGHLLGVGLTRAECDSGGAPWVRALLIVAAAVMVLAACASGFVIARTQNTGYEEEPPLSRIRFFAIAALVANVVFALVMTLDLVGNFNASCGQS